MRRHPRRVELDGRQARSDRDRHRARREPHAQAHGQRERRDLPRRELEALDRAEVLASLLLHVESAVDELAQNGAAATIGALREHLAMVGDEIEIDGRAGVLAGIDDDGLLLVREGAQLRRVASGTLRRRG